MYYIIYKTTNLINNKFYIGMHKTNNIEDGYLGSGKLLIRSINKYGIKNFKREILFIFNSEEEMRNKEKEILTEQFLEENKDKTYNILVGGQGGFEYINKSGLRNSSYEFGINKETTIKNSKLGNSSLNKKLNKDNEFKKIFKNKISLGMKNKYNSGLITFLGKKHRKDTIEKMKLSHKDKHHGKDNSQYGTCWIYRNSINKKIKKDELNEWIELGWNKGRK